MGNSDINSRTKLFIAVTVLECVVVGGLTLERLFVQSAFNNVGKAALLLFLATLFMLYFAIHGALSENRFELISYLFVTILISFCTIYAFIFYGHTENGPQNIVVWIRLITACIICPLNFIVGWITYKAFGWKIYHKLGANILLHRVYKKYQIFLSLLKIDLLFGSGLVLGIGLFQLDNAAYFYLDLAMLPITIGWAVLGWFGVRHEEKKIMVVYLVFSVVEPMYIIWKVVAWVPEKIGVHTLAVIIAAGSFAIIVRICLMCFAIMAYKNFDQGLKAVFERRAHEKERKYPTEAAPFLN